MQGLKFEFEDGTVEAYGMEINDETDVTELEVPKGQHIKDVVLRSEKYVNQIGKKHALKKYDQFTLNTSCFWGITRSNVTLVVQFHEIFVTKIMNNLIYYNF